MATDFVTAGSINFTGPSEFGTTTPTITAFEAAGEISFTGDSESSSVSNADSRFVAEGGLELSGRSDIESSAPETTVLLASGSLHFSGRSLLNSASFYTDLVATGGLVLSGRSAFGEQTVLDISSQTDFTTTGSLRMSSDAYLGHVSPESKTTALTASGSLEFSGQSTITYPAGTVHDFSGTLSFLLGGRPTSAVIFPSVTAFVATGGYILCNSEDAETVFEAWVLNGQSFEPSIFSAFNFNSFAQLGSQTFAAGENGIYLLGGDNDNGDVYHTGARVGPVNFGADREKRVRGIQMGDCGPDTKVKVVADDGDGGEGVFTPDIDSNRVVSSRDIQGRAFTVDFQDFDELSHLEITTLKLARR